MRLIGVIDVLGEENSAKINQVARAKTVVEVIHGSEIQIRKF